MRGLDITATSTAYIVGGSTALCARTICSCGFADCAFMDMISVSNGYAEPAALFDLKYVEDDRRKERSANLRALARRHRCPRQAAQRCARRPGRLARGAIQRFPTLNEKRMGWGLK